jgi:hypothetical protein
VQALGESKMKITIELNLENEDDLYKYKLITNAEALLYVLHTLKQDMRNTLKYGKSSNNPNLTENSTLDEWHNYLYELTEEKQISIDLL